MFDDLLERNKDAEFYVFYESYYNAVMNLSEIETISITKSKEKQDQVIQTGARISTVTNGLVLYYVKKGFFELARSIPEVSNHIIEKSGNFYRQFTLNKNYLFHLVKEEKVIEPKIFSKRWQELFEDVKNKLEMYIDDRDWT